MSTFKSSKQKGSNLCLVKYFTCTSKVRDKYGNIRGYVIEDDSGKSTQISANNLKNALRNNNIRVTNLKLTSDGRLIDTKQGNQTAHSKIPQLTQPKKKETLKPEELVALYYHMREEELNKHKAKTSADDYYDILRKLPKLSDAGLAWLSSIATLVFTSCNRHGIAQSVGFFGQQAFCCNSFDTITGISRELVINGLLDAEYHRSTKDILRFVSDWKICYCVSGNYETKQIIISLGMRKPYKTPSSSGALYHTCEFSDYQVVVTEQDLLSEDVIAAINNLYTEYLKADKEYKLKLTDTKIEALRYMREHTKRMADMIDAELRREKADRSMSVKLDKEQNQPQSSQYTKHSVTQYDNQHYAQSQLDRVAFALHCGLYHIGIFNGRSVYCSKPSSILAEYGHDAETGIVEPISEEDKHYISVINTDNETERAKGIFGKLLKSKKQTEDMFRLCLIESKDRKATELCLCTLHIQQLSGDMSVALVLYTGDSVRIDSNATSMINRTILEKANDNLAKTFISLKRNSN